MCILEQIKHRVTELDLEDKKVELNVYSPQGFQKTKGNVLPRVMPSAWQVLDECLGEDKGFLNVLDGH